MLKSTAITGGMTLISRILGFLRDMVLARFFGAGVGADAFFVAFKIPNFMRRLFAEGAFSQAFVPVLTEYKTRRQREETEDLVGAVSGTLGLFLFILTLIGVVAAPAVITVFAPGFVDQGDKFDLAVQMLRLTFPYLLFISLTAMAGAVLNSYGRFGVPAFTPVFLNLCMIGAALWLAPRMEQPVIALAWGVFAAGVVQLLFQLPYLADIGLLRRPRIGWRHDGVRRIVRLMVPAIFGASVTQINLLVDTILASFLVTGSVSWLYYSDRLVEFPLGVFGIALATVILPSLSSHQAADDPARFNATIDWALRLTLLIGLPASLGLIVLAPAMLATLFQYGEFTQHDTLMAARSLYAYGFGLLGFVLVKVLAPGFYARQDTKTPVKIGVIAMSVNIGLNLALVWHLAHAGLALATALAAFVNAALLYRGLRGSGVYRPLAGWPRFWLQVSGGCLLMVGWLWWVGWEAESWSGWGAIDRALRLTWLIVSAAAIYLAVLLLAGVRKRDLMLESRVDQ